jgi:hypothetical protein
MGTIPNFDVAFEGPVGGDRNDNADRNSRSALIIVIDACIAGD